MRRSIVLSLHPLQLVFSGFINTLFFLMITIELKQTEIPNPGNNANTKTEPKLKLKTVKASQIIIGEPTNTINQNHGFK